MENKLEEALNIFNVKRDATSPSYTGPGTFAIKNPVQGYSTRYRGEWFKPDYNFNDIVRAQDSDSYLAKSIEKKSVKFLLAGYEFSGENPKTVEYINKRVKQIEVASKRPLNLILLEAASDLFSKNNHVWILVRNEKNSGGKIYNKNGKPVKPISAIFPIAFETLEFKTKDNGEIERIKQVVPGAVRNPEFSGEDIIHFYMNKRPGYITGSPTMFSALEDILLLRRIEENVEELIESNLFPLFHYKIGTKEAPERVNPKTGLREAEEISRTLKFMPSSGVYISDWRHEITAVGSEGKALRIDYYLEYFKKRVFSALGVSPVDMGESDSSNRSTAQTQSKSLTEAVESLQALMKTFLDFYLIQPLLMESDFGFDPLTPENIVEINFNKIDVSEQTLMENNASQLFQANAISHEEMRKKIGHRPMKPEAEGSLNYNKFPNKAEEAKIAALKAGSTGSTTAANQHGTSQKKTAAKKDNLHLVENDLEVRFLALSTIYSISDEIERQAAILKWKEDFNDRCMAIYYNRIHSSDAPTKKLHDLLTKEGLESYSRVNLYFLDFVNNLIQNLNVKIDKLHNNGIVLETIFELSKWRVSSLSDRIEKFYTNIVENGEINTNTILDES